MSVNKLILGDNLEILKTLETESVDLIYLDPPFFSNHNYEVIWGDKGEIRSFEDRWSGGIDHYIAWLKERVAEMHRILKSSGSIFLHCDWHADAYIRVLILDKIFKPNNFRNEIIWYYRRWSAASNNFQRMHDNIFWYSKNPEKFTFTKPLQEYSDPSLIETTVRGLVNGKLQRLKNPDGTYVQREKENKGVLMHDVWTDINFIPPTSKERIGYPTQKPEALLERIIKCATNESDVVLDPFMGGGTTIAVADRLKRKWIGIDQSVQAVKVTELRLNKQTDMFTSIYANSYSLQLHKYDYDTLRNMDAFEFESWIIGQYGGTAHNRKGGDNGIDGKSADGIPIQVKRSDNIGVNVIKNFSVSAKQYDKTLFEKNKKAQNPVGYIIAFSFGKGAIKEVARLQNEENIIIRLVNVDEIIPLSRKPNIIVKINEISREYDSREIAFTASGQSNAGIEFYSWDFNYDSKNGFKADVMIDKEGKQTVKLKAGLHNIAVKVVDNDGLESLEVIKLKVNGIIERK